MFEQRSFPSLLHTAENRWGSYNSSVHGLDSMFCASILGRTRPFTLCATACLAGERRIKLSGTRSETQLVCSPPVPPPWPIPPPPAPCPMPPPMPPPPPPMPILLSTAFSAICAMHDHPSGTAGPSTAALAHRHQTARVVKPVHASSLQHSISRWSEHGSTALNW